MSQIHNGIFGGLAIALTLGAVQFASGHDLTGRQAVVSATAPETAINRAAKADRSSVKPAPGPTRTIVLRHDGLADTSVLVRVPDVREEARNKPASAKSPARKMAVACEPPVSVLTEVAKLLQPGRCVT